MKTRFLLTAFCTLFSTWQWYALSFVACGNCMDRMQSIVDMQDGAPFVYRQLTPQIIVALGNTPQVILGFQVVMFALFYILLWIWCQRWCVAPVAVLPLVAMITAVMMPTYYFSLYTLPEWNFVLCALLLLPRWSSLAPLTGK